MPSTKNKIISEYFKDLNKKSQESQFGKMTKKKKSEYFRRLQKLSTARRKALANARTVR